MKVITAALLFLCMNLGLSAQNEKGHFMIEFEAFSPPIKDLIASFENSKAAPFLAPDILGEEQYLGDYSDKNVILWFWSTSDELSNSQIERLNLLQSKFRNDLQVISFAEEEKQELLDFRRSIPVDFPIIANGKILGEAAFGGDLGQGRLFLIDKAGIIQKVIPRQAFEENFDNAFKFTEDMLKSI